MFASLLAYVRRHHVALIALSVALGGTSYAALHDAGNTSNTVRACVKKRGGAVRVIKAGAKCKRGERRLAWNRAGVPGPAGAPGATGPQGAAGSDAAVPTPGPWHRVGGQGEPTYGDEWSQNADRPLEFRTEPHGIVRLRGWFDQKQNGTWSSTSTPVFTLPPGFRPYKHMRIAIAGELALEPGQLFLNADDGTVIVQGQTAGSGSVNSVTFNTEP
jgi:predicted ribosomally synthesized peptide with SipW-like signal peptide